MNISTLLDHIHSGHMALPEFRRGYRGIARVPGWTRIEWRAGRARRCPAGLRFHLGREGFAFYSPIKMKDDPLWLHVSALMNRIRDIGLRIEEVTGEDKTIDVVVDIFNRVNSGGTKLSKGDLALAKICADWPEARDRMKRALATWRANGFEFSLDWPLRNGNTDFTGEAKFNHLHDIGPVELEDGLKRAEASINYHAEPDLRAARPRSQPGSFGPLRHPRDGFLTKDTNLQLSNGRPEVYFPEVEAAHPGALSSQWVPMAPELWKIENYPAFPKARQRLLAEAASTLLVELSHGELDHEPKEEPVAIEVGARAVPAGIDAPGHSKSISAPTSRWGSRTQPLRQAWQVASLHRNGCGTWEVDE